MKLTTKLLSFLNRVFDKDPKAFVALRVRYDGGGLTWSVADGILTFVVTGGGGAGVTYRLADFTLRSLVSDIASRTGYEVAFLDPDRADLSARVLLDGSGDQDKSNGDAILGYTSVLWGIFEAYASELQVLHDAMEQLPFQMATTTAQGQWLDELGSYYGVTRDLGEVDPIYGQRIIAQTLRPIGNNVAIERAIEHYTGQPCNVVDVVTYHGGQLYDGSVNHDGTIHYDSLSPPIYGLFDVTVSYDLVVGGDVATFLTVVRAIVERLRDAGTHLRALALSDATPLLDAFPSPADATSAWTATSAMTDTLTAPADTAPAWAGSLGALSDTLTAPTEAATGAILAILRTDSGAPITDESGNPIQGQVAPLFV